MYSSMPCQRNLHNIVEEPVRVNHPGTFKLSTFVREPVLVRHTLTNKKSSRKFQISQFLIFITYTFTFIHNTVFLLAKFDFDPNSVRAFQLMASAWEQHSLLLVTMHHKCSSKTSSVISAGTGFNARLVIFVRHTLTNKESSRKFQISTFLVFITYTFTFIHNIVFLLAKFDFDHNSVRAFHLMASIRNNIHSCQWQCTANVFFQNICDISRHRVQHYCLFFAKLQISRIVEHQFYDQ